jgi:hypothetical protein
MPSFKGQLSEKQIQTSLRTSVRRRQVTPMSPLAEV